MSGQTKYAWNAKDYAENSAAQRDWALELLAKLDLKPDYKVLDIGCGDGKNTAEIAAKVTRGEVVGLDNSKDMIELASTTYPKTQFRNLTFKFGDANSMIYRDEFDAIFSNAALHWVKDHSLVLKGIASSLKSGGRMLLQMGGKGNAAKILVILDKMVATRKWSRYFQDFQFPYGFYGVDEYKNCLELAGLQPVRIELIKKQMTYPDRSGLAGWVRTTWLPYTGRVPASEQQEFVDELVARYAEEECCKTGGNISVAMVRLEVEAQKPHN